MRATGTTSRTHKTSSSKKIEPIPVNSVNEKNIKEEAVRLMAMIRAKRDCKTK